MAMSTEVYRRADVRRTNSEEVQGGEDEQADTRPASAEAYASAATTSAVTNTERVAGTDTRMPDAAESFACVAVVSLTPPRAAATCEEQMPELPRLELGTSMTGLPPFAYDTAMVPSLPITY
jgi:hypothetical protein